MSAFTKPRQFASKCLYVPLNNSLTHSYTHSPTPWNRDLRGKLTGTQLGKKFPEFYGARMFIPAFRSARYLSLLWARSYQLMPSFYFLKIHFNLILPSAPGSSKWTLSLRFSHQNPVCNYPLLHTCYIHCLFHSFRFDHQNNIWRGVRIIKLLVM